MERQVKAYIHRVAYLRKCTSAEFTESELWLIESCYWENTPVQDAADLLGFTINDIILENET